MSEEIFKEIISLDQISTYSHDPLTVLRLLSVEESPDISLSLISLVGPNNQARNLVTKATYMVLSGNGCFVEWDNVGKQSITPVKSGSSVTIPFGRVYQDFGRLVMVGMNHPAFNPDLVEVVVPSSSRRLEIHSQTDEMAIKQLAPEDALHYFNLINADRSHLSQSHLGSQPDVTAVKYPDVKAVLESIIHPEKVNKIRFSIWDGETMVGSNNITLLSGNRAEIGSWIGKEHTGHHYASKARALLLQFAFDYLQIEEVISSIAIGNEASRKSVEKSGLVY